MPESPATLFLCGVSRSGTTAMADLLRAHPRIAMGRERYAFLFSGGEAFGPELFEKDRFCLEHRAADSHHRVPQPYYAELHARFEDCALVGDKLPNLFEGYDRILPAFPGCKVIYMLRNVFHVAQSFQGRADRTLAQDHAAGRTQSPPLSWPATRGWQRGVEEWNRSLEETMARLDRFDFHVFPYEHLFTGEGLMEGLFDYLGLEVVPEVRSFWAEAAVERERLEDRRSLRFRSEQMDWIMRHARFDLFQEMVRRMPAAYRDGLSTTEAIPSQE